MRKEAVTAQFSEVLSSRLIEEMSVRIVRVPAEIWTGHLQNKCQSVTSWAKLLVPKVSTNRHENERSYRAGAIVATVN
jgi:hypothetical protein